MVVEWHDILLIAKTPAWNRNKLLIMFKLDYSCYCVMCELLQPKSNLLFLAGPRVQSCVPWTNSAPRAIAD